MTTNALNNKRRELHEHIEALAKKQPQAASGRFVIALVIAGFVLFGGLAATFYASAAQREAVLEKHTPKGMAQFNTQVEGAGYVQVNNLSN